MDLVAGELELNARKLGIDLTRGSTLQLQGGAGTTLGRVVDLGLVGYALWQVSDDTGSALPPALRGARDRTYGAGAELGITFAEAHSRVTLRWVHDVGSVARPQGQLALVGLTWTPWRSTTSRAAPR